MLLPYFFSALFYFFTALLIAADVSLVTLQIVPAFGAFRWMRVHFLTLGLLSQIIFGILPILVAARAQKPRPAMNWWVWLSLNAGFLLLIAGFMGTSHNLILLGGTLVFIAAVILLSQLWQLSGAKISISGWFYITGAAYLLLGIIIGTGLWLNWGAYLQIRTPLEVHIHANSWGFMSLVFTGLLVDFLPVLTGKKLGTDKQLWFIYLGMTFGALGLILGPWLPNSISLPPTVVGLVLHLSGTICLLVLLVRVLQAGGFLRQAGGWHLVASYLWILLPVLIAPFIVLKFLESGPIESTAPQPLVYGWIAQFGIALIPFIARRHLLNEKNPALGGSWLSLACLTLGGMLIWVSIYLPLNGALYGIGFALYVFAFLKPLSQMLEILRKFIAQNAQMEAYPLE